jgi:hypothetical protein
VASPELRRGEGQPLLQPPRRSAQPQQRLPVAVRQLLQKRCSNQEVTRPQHMEAVTQSPNGRQHNL